MTSRGRYDDAIRGLYMSEVVEVRMCGGEKSEEKTKAALVFGYFFGSKKKF
jgi:hypothetical protein